MTSPPTTPADDRFRLLVESVQDYAIFMLDTSGRVQSWNRGAERLKGYEAGEIIGRPFEVFYPREMVERGWPREELERAAALGRFEDEGWRVRKDGSVFWASVVITALRDEQGQLTGFGKVTRDLTEQRRVQEIEHSSRRMHEFLAMLAHELRNPLAPIRNASEIMQRMPELPAPLVLVRQIIDRQLRHLTRLIDELLDAARIVNGKIVLRPELLDYRDVVSTSVDAVRPLVASRSQRLEVELPASVLTMRADATRIAQSLQNLLGNASRYTPEGGKIRVAVRVERSACVTTVTDTGCGIAPEALERIFGLFEQEDTPQEHGESGLGIGLSLARKLVELHGGTLCASSQGPGQGSAFTMLLPLELRDALLPPPYPRPEDASPMASCRVLVVDDNRDAADTMVALLQLLGHEAHAVYGALDATGAAGRFQPQVVLLDLNMPDGDGFSVLQQLREAGHGTVFVAAMTGYGQQADRRRTAQAGFQAHLTKPASITELQRVLRTAVAA